MNEYETLRAELDLLHMLLSVAFDLAARVPVPRADLDDGAHGQLAALLLLLRDRAGILHQRAVSAPRRAA